MEEDREINERGNGMHIVDEETGEIVGQINPGDKVVHPKELSKYDQTHVKDFNKGKPFVKLYTDIIPVLIKHLTSSELKMVMALIPLVKYQDCTIEKTVEGHSKILDIQGISDETGLEYEFVKRYMRGLRQKGIIGFQDTGSILSNSDSKSEKVYTVNPYVFFNGKDANSSIYKFYKNSGWEEALLKYNADNKIMESNRHQIKMDEKYKKISNNKSKIPGYIYVMKNCGYCKIGRTNLQKKRLGEYTHLPEEPEYLILKKVSDTVSTEKYIHDLFKNKRVRGEWFILNDEDIDEINRVLDNKE